MKKGYIFFAIIVSLIFALLIMWYEEYPGKANFICNKNKYICTATYQNIFGHEFFRSIPLDTVINANLEERLRQKRNSGRYNTGTHDCYNYYFYLNFNNHGKVDTFPVYVSSDFEYYPADENFDDEYRYYKEAVSDFNIFLKEDKLTIYELRDYVSMFAKSDYWADLLFLVLMGGVLLFGLTIPVIIAGLDIIATYIPFLKPFEKLAKIVFKD